MYVVKDWSSVKLITDPDTSNYKKTWAFPMPKFDAESFPFIVVAGLQNFSIVNVATLECKPLAIG